jgi:hypothetical protein
MSRGLGKMQRLILQELRSRRGGGIIERPWSSDVVLPDDVHDLREVSLKLAREHGGISHCSFIAPRWEASFSRAVRRLVAVGLIEHTRGYRGMQRRFVRVLLDLAKIHNA